MSGSLPGLRHVDHIGLTVPDLDEAVAFFVDVLGAVEVYRSTRGPDAEFMTVNFEVPADAALELSMLRMAPNLNVELFEWSSATRDPAPPRSSDAGGRHLAFVVDDVDIACDYLRAIEGVRILGEVKEVGGDSPRVRGNRWAYVVTPFGLLLELVDRSRVAEPPALVGPVDWGTAG